LKKVFKLTQENKHPDRVLDSIKYEVRKYLKRERKKSLPGDSAFWEFECRFGKDSSLAQSTKASEIIHALDKAKEEGWDACYIEIVAKASQKMKKKPEPAEEKKS